MQDDSQGFWLTMKFLIFLIVHIITFVAQIPILAPWTVVVNNLFFWYTCIYVNTNLATYAHTYGLLNDVKSKLWNIRILTNSALGNESTSVENSKHCLAHVYIEYILIETRPFVHTPTMGKGKRTSINDKNKVFSRYSRKKNYTNKYNSKDLIKCTSYIQKCVTLLCLERWQH